MTVFQVFLIQVVESLFLELTKKQVTRYAVFNILMNWKKKLCPGHELSGDEGVGVGFAEIVDEAVVLPPFAAFLLRHAGIDLRGWQLVNVDCILPLYYILQVIVFLGGHARHGCSLRRACPGGGLLPALGGCICPGGSQKCRQCEQYYGSCFHKMHVCKGRKYNNSFKKPIFQHRECPR